METRSLVLLGATVSAIALAQKRPDALILESGTLLGGEFLASLNMKPDDGRPLSPESESLRAACRAVDALGADGRYYAPPIQALLAERLTAAGAEIRFQAQVLDALPGPGGFLVRYWDCEGLHMLSARQVVDTRSQGGRKSLCAMLDQGPLPPPAEDGSYTVLPGHLPGECVIKWHLPENAAWPEARQIIHEGIGRLPGRRLTAIAPIFCYDFDAPVCGALENGLIQCFSAAYPHLFAAFEGGIACAAAL